jgi:hypothetical protein
MKRLILTLLLLVCLFGGALYAQTLERTYEVGAVLLPYLNAMYLGRNQTGPLLLWSYDIGNYVIVPKISTKWVLTYNGVTYTFTGLSDSTIRLDLK